MTCIDNHDLRQENLAGDVLQRAWHAFSSWVEKGLRARAKRREQIQNRQAFLNLLGKDDWLYRDMGINPGDVEWASKLPLEVNAALELEKIRQQYRRSL